MSESPQYFNFPVHLLNGIFEDHKKALNDIIYWSLYTHTAKLEMGNDIEKFTAAANHYNVDLKGSEKSSFKRGEQLYFNTPDNSPKVGINLPMLWDFMGNKQTQFDIACLTAFLAIKSILGKNDFCKTNNLLLWSRMDGKSKAITYTSELSLPIRQYCNDYQTVKIKNELCRNWGLVTYSRYTKGFYVTLKLDLEALVLTAEKARKTSAEKARKQQERDTINKALKSLNSG